MVQRAERYPPAVGHADRKQTPQKMTGQGHGDLWQYGQQAPENFEYE